MIVIVFGLPGSGKSYFASRFAHLVQADYVNSDRVRKEMFSERDYSVKEKEAVYTRMLDLMEKAISEKKDLILDATFHKEKTREMFIEKINERVPVFFIEVQAEESMIMERLKMDRLDSEANFEVYKMIRQQNQPFYEPHLIIQSTNDNLDEMLKKAEDYLKTKND